MKRREFLIATPLALAACTTWIKPEDGSDPVVPPEVIAISVNTVGFSVGILTARLHPAVDTTLRQVYTVFVEGKLELDELNQLLNELLLDEDLAMRALANRLVKALEALGAVVIKGKITELEGIDPELAQEFMDGYIEGYDLSKTSRGW
jgi:hypothetical protein